MQGQVVSFMNMYCRAGAVMVCTDSAARGLDIPDIGHVVQADFASSAVDFLHRVRSEGPASFRMYPSLLA